ncbi:MAG: Abi family protein [Alphaproteobacteria bacterium]|nr:Abi family protein [Alphaproteobacteria bacterium]
MKNLSPPTEIEDQIRILKERGMSFIDEERAKKYIRYIGYKRLSWYWTRFYKSEEKFIDNLKFEDVLSVYIFDRKLRALFLEVSERVELCLKTLFSDTLSLKHDALWYLNASFFNTKTDKYYKDNVLHEEKIDHGTLMHQISDELDRHKNNSAILKNFKSIYSSKIPSWDLFQLLTFGKFSRVLELTNGIESKEFYDLFSLPKAVFDNWVECMVAVRNICAHYGLFYARDFSNKPKNLAKSDKRAFSQVFDKETQNKFFAQFFVFAYFLFKISPTSGWVKRVISEIESIISKTSLISFESLGFPEDWKENAVFKEMLKDKEEKLF